MSLGNANGDVLLVAILQESLLWGDPDSALLHPGSAVIQKHPTSDKQKFVFLFILKHHKNKEKKKNDCCK